MFRNPFTRRPAAITPTRTWAGSAAELALEAVWPVSGVAAAVMVFAFAGYLDEKARTEHELAEARVELKLQQAYARGAEAGAKAAEARLVATAEAGWSAARTEADRCRTGGR